MKKESFLYLVGLMLVLCISANAGSLSPPGPLGPTMKSLDEIAPCSPVDAGDMPLNIDQPGVYCFTENVSFSTENANAVTVVVNDVVIDLGGFKLEGPGKSAGSTGSGIYAYGKSRVKVMNGEIRSFRERGVVLGEFGQAVSVHSGDNGVAGIASDANSVVQDCVCVGNGAGSSSAEGVGIEVDDRSRVENCNASENIGGSGASAYGIKAQSHCRIFGNIASENMGGQSAPSFGAGIYTADYCVVESNICNSNQGNSDDGGSYGIWVGDSTAVVSNTSCRNNRPTYQSRGYGILANDNCLIEGNEVVENGSFQGNPAICWGYGICCNNGNRVLRNHCAHTYAPTDGEAFGIKVTSSNLVEGNHVHGHESYSDYGIAVFGNENIILSNRIHGHQILSIYFSNDASYNYFAANIFQGGISSGGECNTGGDVPAGNAGYGSCK